MIFAIRDKVLNPENFPKLLSQATKLYGTFYRGIQTNLTLQDAIQLAALMRDIPRANIRNEVIDNKMIGFGNVTLGGVNASVIRPLPDQIRLLRDHSLPPEEHSSTGERGPDDVDAGGSCRLRILNGTSTRILIRARQVFLRRRESSRPSLARYKPLIAPPSFSIHRSYIHYDIWSIFSGSQTARRSAFDLTHPKPWISR